MYTTSGPATGRAPRTSRSPWPGGPAPSCRPRLPGRRLFPTAIFTRAGGIFHIRSSRPARSRSGRPLTGPPGGHMPTGRSTFATNPRMCMAEAAESLRSLLNQNPPAAESLAVPSPEPRLTTDHALQACAGPTQRSHPLRHTLCCPRPHVHSGLSPSYTPASKLSPARAPPKRNRDRPGAAGWSGGLPFSALHPSPSVGPQSWHWALQLGGRLPLSQWGLLRHTEGQEPPVSQHEALLLPPPPDTC